MTPIFQKFPHTPHLLWLGKGHPRDDKILTKSEVESFLDRPIIVEEKVDGANLGLSVGPDGRIRAQNRGNFLVSGHSEPQWSPLWAWIAKHDAKLVETLGAHLTLFGEWVYARHSVYYDRLPDWFLVFDVYDVSNDCFWSVDRRNELVCSLDLKAVPEIYRGQRTLEQLPELIGVSSISSSRMEGIYLRSERNRILQARAKIVSADFIQQIDIHWTRKALSSNRLALTE